MREALILDEADVKLQLQLERSLRMFHGQPNRRACIIEQLAKRELPGRNYDFRGRLFAER